LNLLFAVATIPNTIVPIFSGWLVDIFSLRTLFTIFTSLVIVGQAIFSIGVSYSHFPTMVLGRFITGVGFGADDLVQCKITTDWFKSNFLAFALAMNLTFGRLGTAANFNITPMLLDKFGFDEAQACWFGLVVAMTSGLAVIVTTYLDRPESRAAAGVAMEGTTEVDYDSISDDIDQDKVNCSDFSRLGPMFFALLLCVMTLYGACQPFLHIASDVSDHHFRPYLLTLKT
jgi:MFS family permease